MQRYRTVILLLLLIVVPLVAVVLLARIFVAEDAPAPVPARATPAPVAAPVGRPETRTVFAAARRLPVGTLLGEEDLIEIEVAPNEIRRGYIVAQAPTVVDTLRGHAVREAISAGAPVTRSAIVGPRQRGFLAAALTPGTRAVTVQLGSATSHAGLIDPGDRVDVILTAKLRLADGGQSVFTRRILEDARVVAVDRRLGNEASPSTGGQQVDRAEIVTATIEVSPAQADRLALGGHEGKLSLSVRSLAAAPARRTPAEAVDLQELLSLPKKDPGTAEPDERIEPVAAEEPRPETTDPPFAPLKKVRVIRGDKVTEETFPGPDGVQPTAAGVVRRPGSEVREKPVGDRSSSRGGPDEPSR